MSRPEGTYHVKPKSSGSGWLVQKEGTQLPSAETQHKDQAIARARELAARTLVGRIVIHSRDGSTEEEIVSPGTAGAG